MPRLTFPDLPNVAILERGRRWEQPVPRGARCRFTSLFWSGGGGGNSPYPGARAVASRRYSGAGEAVGTARAQRRALSLHVAMFLVMVSRTPQAGCVCFGADTERKGDPSLRLFWGGSRKEGGPVTASVLGWI